MTDQEIVNALVASITIVWIVKIISHFEYLKANDESIGQVNFFSFIGSVNFLFQKVMVILPVFFGSKRHGQKAKNVTRISLVLLWILLILTWVYLYFTTRKS